MVSLRRLADGTGDPRADRAVRRLTRELYIPAGDVGFWQGAVRDPDDPYRSQLLAAIAAHDRLTIDMLYGDHEGGQRVIARFALTPVDNGKSVHIVA